MAESTNHRPWDTEAPLHKISHDEYYEKRGTTDKTKHKPSMPQPRIRHTRITTTLINTYLCNHGLLNNRTWTGNEKLQVDKSRPLQ